MHFPTEKSVEQWGKYVQGNNFLPLTIMLNLIESKQPMLKNPNMIESNGKVFNFNS